MASKSGLREQIAKHVAVVRSRFEAERRLMDELDISAEGLEHLSWLERAACNLHEMLWLLVEVFERDGSEQHSGDT